MAKLCKRMKALNAKVEANKLYTAVEALELIKETAVAKFDESVDVAVQLGIDPRKSDQAVRGAVVMPEGTGKTVRVAVFTQGAKAEEALAAGADIVGFDDLAAKVKAGELDFDVVIASPDAMRVVGQPDAEPEGRYCHPERCPGCQERQGRSGSVPRRQGWYHPRPDRSCLLHG